MAMPRMLSSTARLPRTVRNWTVAAVVALAAASASGQPASQIYNFWRNKLGGAQTTVWDNKQITLNASGSVTVRRLSDGLIVTFSTDGTEWYQYPDGRQVYRFPDGRRTTISPSGTRVIEWPTGTVSVYFTDGREEHTRADGTFVVISPTGPIARTERRPDGLRIYNYRDGSVVWFFTNGVRKTYFPNGTVITGLWLTTAPIATTPGAPSAPNNLGLDYSPSTGMQVTWSDQSWNETNFIIERLPPFPGGTVEAPRNTAGWVDPSAQPWSLYRIAAANNSGISGFTPWRSLASEPTEFPVLIPGDGFAGPTDQPPAVGNASMAGYDAKAIARWDVVPYQTFDGDFHIGVVAFHMNGIEKVSFSVNGGPWSDVTEMKLNPRTDVWEYTVTLRANYFEDGPVEVRAIAWPEGAGEARVLGGEIGQTNLSNGEHSLVVIADLSGTFGPGEVYVSASRGDDTTGTGSFAQPYATIWKALQKFAGQNVDGLDILLEPGEYPYGSSIDSGRPHTLQGWVTIRPVPGSPEGSVVFTSGGRFRVANIRLLDVTLDFSGGGSIGNYTVSTLPSMVWLDRVRATGPGAETGARVAPAANWLGWYVTDTSIERFTDGAMFAQIVRGVELGGLGSDAFTGSHLVLDSTVDGLLKPAGTSFHPDVYQFSVTPGSIRENVIVYGVVAINSEAQGLFADDGGTVDNVAFVNVLIDAANYKSQWKDIYTNHILFWNTTLAHQPMAWRTSLHRNISIVGSVWHAIEGPAGLLGGGGAIDVRHNHFVTSPGMSVGTDMTTGSPGWDSNSAVPYTPAAGSPLRGRLPAALVPVDALRTRRAATQGDLGAITRAATNSGN